MTKNLRAFLISILLSLTTCGLPSIAFSQAGGPIADLQDSVAQIEAAIEDLTQAAGSIETTIDCGTQTVSAFIDANSDTAAPLIITIQGTCTENILLTRGRVVLKGDPDNGPDGITGVTPGETVLLINGSNEVVVQHLTITGSGFGSGINCRANSAVTISNVTVTGASFGIVAGMSGQCDVSDSMITGNNRAGVLAVNNGAMLLVDTQITGNGAGVVANRSGHVTIVATTNGVFGGLAISNNMGHGIEVSGSASVRIFGNSDINHHVVIQDNVGAGVLIGNLGMFEPRRAIDILGNDQEGILCRTDQLSGAQPISGAFELRWPDSEPGPGREIVVNGNAFGELSALCPVPPWPLQPVP